jgi:hypothetical protein
MTKKFIRTIKDEAKDIARNINDQTVTAYDLKRQEIESKYIPEKALAKLSPAEIRRAERIGLVIGVVFLLVILYLIAKWAGWLP